ncbi:hypothetical protein DV737_g2437, partial [Chaetothyriales sp. CBS 132003]
MEQSDTVILDDSSTRAEIAALLQASSDHDLSKLQRLIDSCSFPECKAVDILDPLTGRTPLHAAIASCQATGADIDGDLVSKAHETVKLLLENGAIWNQLDRNEETPGCVAFRLGLETLYQLMVDAGVRAEMLLNRLGEYEELDADEEDSPDSEGPSTERKKSIDANLGPDVAVAPPVDAHLDPASAKYLSSTLSLGGDKILDAELNGVMMAWENDIMKQSADALLESPGRKILNIGFGMGIIDSHIQSHENRPVEHHIIEAHPDVLKSINDNGWPSKPGVTVHAGRWQEVLPKLLEDGITFDAVYYDTFAESYMEFKDFFTEHLLGLLEPDGVWSFFNGMGADRQISYDVYQKVVEIDLFEAGFEVEWVDIDVPNLSNHWKGVKRKYWDVERYRFPVCKFVT